MQAFKWKKKLQKKDVQNRPKLFMFEDDDLNEEIEDSVDWLTSTKKKEKVLSLEDAESKSRRLVDEGIIFAENERWWEAIGRWNSALTYTPDQYKVHEMLAQAYMMVGEIYPALKSAVTATTLAPWWWAGHQTHGRALLGLGEVAMSIKAFSRAIHIQPDNMDLWKNDLEWSVKLLKKHRELEAVADEKEKENKLREEAKNEGFFIEEITEKSSVESMPLKIDTDNMKLDSQNLELAETSSSFKLGLKHKNNNVTATFDDRKRPPITCTSKKRKFCSNYDPNLKDPRFAKDLAVLDEYGKIITEAGRIQMHPRKMICYRR